MYQHEPAIPHLNTAYQGPLEHLEKIILEKVPLIESWFRQQWQKTPASITCSVDLRHAGFKLAPVDTNLFPAGFNNLNREFLPLCVQAVQTIMVEHLPSCKKVLILPESHTRNRFYLESLAVLRDIFVQAGFIVRIASLDPELREPIEFTPERGVVLKIEPANRRGDALGLEAFAPCLVLLNNDLSAGVPPLLQNVKQLIRPTSKLGWFSRLKSDHFQLYDQVAQEFAERIAIDPWLINPYFCKVTGLDFMAQEGLNALTREAEALLERIQQKYQEYGVRERPFLAVKADNGTYGMNVMMIHEASELGQMNRKQRTKMSSGKGGVKIEKVILQEGVYSNETTADGAIAEPVVYLIGPFVIGGFYRVHRSKARDENLNAPGMHFEPLAFTEACNMPRGDLPCEESPNRFYVYGVIARLAALAAAREIAAVGGE